MSVMLSHVVAVRENINGGYMQDEPELSTSSNRVTLERDIRLLRSMMENAAELENSMTSDLVLHLSRLLDKKINEYMKTVLIPRKKS